MNFPVRKLCRGVPAELVELVRESGNSFLFSCFLLSVLCSSIFGLSVGIWRAPLQGFYVAMKFPLLIVLVTVGNALLNSMFAKVLGAKLSFRESFTAVLMSFTIASVILASFAPLMICLIWNCPSVSEPDSTISHHAILLFNVVAIAFAGVVSNLHLYKLVLHLTESKIEAKRIIFSWLAVNLLLGSQLSWIMRPFIGGPKGAVEFLRDNAMSGNFFEAVFHTAKDLLF